MSNRYFLFTLAIAIYIPAATQIRMDASHRYLQTRDGKPFFWLGDTDWELFHRLTREETDFFLETRRKQGFNVIQAVALAEFEGLRKPNRYGDLPLVDFDPARLNTTPGNDPADSQAYDYWDHVDYVINLAAKKGMYIGLLPTWGDKVTVMWGDGPKIFNETNAEAYATSLAGRYAKNWNVIWILGGDRPALYPSREGNKDSMVDDRPIWRAMARGIEKVMGKNAFITYHPSGGKETRTSVYLQEEDWMDMNTFQSGHGSREADAWNWVAKDISLKPQKPVLDMEPCYEDYPVNPWDGKWTRQRGYFTAYDVRARIYRGIFAGACGVTYGHHQVWQFLDTTLNKPINVGDTLIGWKIALVSEAANEMQYLKRLLLSRPFFSRIPDQSIIVSDKGSSYIDFITASRDEGGSYALVYLPQNRPVTIDLSKIRGETKNISWFNPRNGELLKSKPLKSMGPETLSPPAEGKDWVLMIDDASKQFSNP